MHQHHQVETGIGKRQRMHVALAHFHIAQLAQALAGGGDHARAGVDADVAGGMRRHQLGQHAVAGGDVEHVAGFQQGQGGARQRFPGAPRGVVPLHVAGHRIGPVLVGRAVGQHRGHALGVLAQQRIVAAGAQCQPQGALRRVQRHLIETVVSRHAGAAVAHQPGFLELGQVRGHARLGQAGDRRQLGHGEFFLLQQGQQADAGGVGKYLQARRPVFQIHEYLYIAIWRYFRPGREWGQLHTHANGWGYNGHSA